MKYIRFMNSNEYTAHIKGRDSIRTVNWADHARSTNKGWCFFCYEEIVGRFGISSFAELLSDELSGEYTHYLVAEGDMTMAFGEYSFGSMVEFGVTDFSALTIIEGGKI